MKKKFINRSDRHSKNSVLSNMGSNSTQFRHHPHSHKRNNQRNNGMRQRIKLLIIIATVSITFFLTWLPVHILRVWMSMFKSSFPYTDQMYIIKAISHVLSYSNSVVNPFVYVFIGARFRQYFYLEFSKIIFCCRGQYKTDNDLLNQTVNYSTVPRERSFHFINNNNNNNNNNNSSNNYNNSTNNNYNMRVMISQHFNSSTRSSNSSSHFNRKIRN
jgi:hypothetical protein